jgi:hypothetical protein
MKKILIVPGMLLLLAACGTEEPPAANEPVEEPAASGGKDGKTGKGREILVVLEQTADPVKRNEAAAAVKESRDFKEGVMGEPTEELAEDMAVQGIEARAVYNAVEAVYGGDAEFEKIGEIFFGNQSSGDSRSGIWVGIKDPDEHVAEFAGILQKQVDAGEILAEPIHIYRIAHTRTDLNDLMYQAAKKVKPMAEAHLNPDSVSYSISADTITGAIEIGHNFLTESQIKELKKAFPDRDVLIEQEGQMVPLEGEPTVKYPDPLVTSVPSEEGYYIVNLEEEGFLAVEAEPKDFGGSGGQEEFYSAIHFAFKDAKKLLDIGQRVEVEAAGSIQESYPGQGRAIFVEVLPAFQPKGADLTEAEVVKQALEGLDSKQFNFPAIRSVTYNGEQDRWTVEIVAEDQDTEKTVEDK